MKTRKINVLHQFVLSYLIVLTESSIDGVKDSCHLPSSLDTSCTCISNYLQCTGINSTQSLQAVQSLEARTITQVEILNSDLKCLDLEHFSNFEFVKVIKVKYSGLVKLFCDQAAAAEAVQSLKYLNHLDLSHNQITHIDKSWTLLSKLHHLNVSHNKLHSSKPVFSSFHQLKSLDLSHNRLTAMVDRAVLEQIPSTISRLDISHNPWPCLPSLSWVYTWSLTLSISVQESMSHAMCRIVNSPSHQLAPLLTVMQYYKLKVTPDCPTGCSCHFYHFAASINISPMATYTVIVNCSHANLTNFPSLPSQTSVLDLSHNKLTQDSYDMLDMSRQNYLEITSLILSHNNIESLGTKLLGLKLHRSFRADHNLLTDIPFDFSLLLQKYDQNAISLGSNPWVCTCNAEITGTSLQEKIHDVNDIVCADGSVPDTIVGRKLLDVSYSVLCPRSQKAEERELVLKVVCGILTFLIILTISKLLYDYWNYRQRGKLPWIVYRMP